MKNGWKGENEGWFDDGASVCQMRNKKMTLTKKTRVGEKNHEDMEICYGEDETVRKKKLLLAPMIDPLVGG